MTEYQVRTDVYNGPMDLLLYLIRREEVDLYDIPIARILGQYLEYVEMLKALDPNVAGDFLVLAATLMEIKSRMLLPHAPAEEQGEDDLVDPRLELVRQLLEYKKFKDASFELGDAAQLQAEKWPRQPARTRPTEASEVDLDEAQIWDLVAAFNKLMLSIGAGTTTHDVVFDDTPIALHAADILDQLQRIGGGMPFEEVFAGRSRAEMIGLFLALLELMRQQRVRIVQAGLFAPILVTLLSAEPITVGHEWEPAIRHAVLGADADRAGGADSGDEVVRSEASGGDEADDGDETFAELDRIKTDIDEEALSAATNFRDAQEPAEGRSP
jgi:segregation and condensation protein A